MIFSSFDFKTPFVSNLSPQLFINHVYNLIVTIKTSTNVTNQYDFDSATAIGFLKEYAPDLIQPFYIFSLWQLRKLHDLIFH